jgi:hypothetical protein
LAEAELTWEAVPGRSYQVQFKPDLSQEQWSALAGEVTATGETAARTDTSAGDGSHRFYRVMLIP